MSPEGSGDGVFRNFVNARIGPIVLEWSRTYLVRKHKHIFQSRMQINIIEFCVACYADCDTPQSEKYKTDFTLCRCILILLIY